MLPEWKPIPFPAIGIIEETTMKKLIITAATLAMIVPLAACSDGYDSHYNGYYNNTYSYDSGYYPTSYVSPYHHAYYDQYNYYNGAWRY